MRLLFGRRAFPVLDRRRHGQEDAGVGHAHRQPGVFAARGAGADAVCGVGRSRQGRQATRDRGLFAGDRYVCVRGGAGCRVDGVGRFSIGLGLGV